MTAASWGSAPTNVAEESASVSTVTARSFITYVPPLRRLQPFPELHAINLARPRIYGFEIDLVLAGHIDVGALENVFLPIDLHEDRAFLHLDDDFMPLVEGE